MTAPSAAEILDKKDYTIEPIEVPEWGENLFIKSVTGEQREEIEVKSQGLRRDPEKYKGLKARCVIYGLCNVDGENIFVDAHLEKLAKKDGRILDEVSQTILKLSGMTEEEVKDIAGNSEEAPTDDSGSTSPDA